MNYLATCLAMVVVLMTAVAHAIGTEQVLAPDPDDRPLALRIWYPDDAARSEEGQGKHLPLIIISHGAGGSNEGHEDTARALAESGFVVAAITHTGDNYRDESYVRQGRNLTARPRHVSRAIDYMLTAWPAHRQLDPQRIGMFGFSAGGFTALVMAGGRPDLARVEPHCRQQPTAWDCEYLARNGISAESIQPPPQSAWTTDAHVKAAVIAAPAVAYSFEPEGLSQVRIPIQLWSAQRDEIVTDGADIVRRLLPVAPEYHRVDNAGHFAFLAPCSVPMHAFIAVMHLFGTESICSDPGGFDRGQFHTEFNVQVVRFFSEQLRRPGDR